MILLTFRASFSGSYYCSVECQTADWRIGHKLLCPSLENFRTPPDPASIRAILFPDDEPSPRFVWIKVDREPLKDEVIKDIQQKVEAREILKVISDNQIGEQYIPQLKRKIPARSHLLVRAEALQDGSPSNKCIGIVTKGNFSFSWRGPVIALRVAQKPGEKKIILDHITMHDYRDVLKFFHSYGQITIGVPDFGPSSFW